MSDPLEIRVSGPLGGYASAFAQELRGRGYTRLTVAGHLRLMAHLSRWLSGEGLDAAALTPERIEAFCAVRRAAGYRRLRTARAVTPLWEFLRRQGACATPPTPAPADAPQRLLERYRAYLVDERGLKPKVVSAWLQAALLFLTEHPLLASDGRSTVGAGQIAAFCARELPRRGPATARNLACALRSFLRFAHLNGLVDVPLVQAVPAVANRQHSGLPDPVTPTQLERLVAGCDRRTRAGRRDVAVLLLLARLGLRAGEVAALGLDDIDWHAGELLVRGKGGRDERMPLPADVGAAVAGYLQHGRPRAVGTRAVFVRAIAPTVALTPTGITWIVYAACDRAGLPRAGAHRLRHCAATGMLRAGASLVEVGQALRHTQVGTTSIYAKVDHVRLRPLAPPWPGSIR